MTNIHLDETNLSKNETEMKKYPLLPTELGMYLEQKLHPESISYNVNDGYVIQGTDADTIRRAVYDILLRHESLHSFYGEVEGVPCRIITEEIPTISDGEELSRDDFMAMLKKPGEPFELEKAVPLRAVLHPLKESGFGLHMQFHHIATDGNSVGLFEKELFDRICGEKIEDKTYDISSVSLSASKDKEEEALAFYDKMFEGGVPVNDLPVKCQRSKNHFLTDTSLEVILGENEISALRKKAKQLGATLFELILSVYASLIGQYSASEDVVVSVPVNTRDELSKDVIGMFVNTVPVRVRPRHEMLFADYLAEASDTIRKATRSYNIPFEILVNRYWKGQDASRNPLFDIGLNYLYVPEPLTKGLVTIDTVSALQPLSRDIAMEVRCRKSYLKFVMQYSADLFDTEIMENFMEHLMSALNSVAKGEVLYVQDLKTLPKKQVMQLEEFSKSADGVLKETLVHKLFEKVAQTMPESVAVIARDDTLTYEQLNHRANSIAWKLIDMGVKKGDSIVLLLPRRSFYFAAALGVMKSGAAFIPCDPEYPAERIQHITDDACAAYIITTSDHLKDYPDGKAIDINTLLGENHTENPCVSMTGDDLAYMIYTSGSTGKPKGVLIRHIGVCNYFADEPVNILYHKIKEINVERILCITTVSFDMSIKDSFGMICNGRAIIFADEDDMNNPVALTGLIDKYDIHLINMTPSRMQQYLEYAPFMERMKTMKMIVLGAEAYPNSLKDRLSKLTNAVLINTYGPTEITISSNMAILNGVSEVSIGRPILNVKEYIVDSTGALAPRGVTGELYIGGPGVARGYNNLKEQTDEKFVDFYGGRFYKSGDYAKWDANGNVHVLGRMDNQIKLRGLRIELGEIEGLMELQPGIRKAIVAVRKIGEQEQLCAWYISDGDVEVSALKNELKKKLTAYMVPAVFTRIEAIPVTANGKINMKALPEPCLCEEESIAPSTAMQQQIFDIVSEVIGNTNFGIETELFSVGLTSINSVSLSIKLSDAFSVNVQIRDFRESDTIEKLEKFIMGLNPEEEFEVYEEYALTKTQEGIFFETQTHPGTTIYNIPSLYVLNAAIDIKKLKRALGEAISAHPYLNVRFFTDEQGRIRQRREDKEEFFKEEDILEIQCTDIDEIKEQLVQPYDLLKDRLFRVKLIKSETKNYLFFEAHHIIFDGQSRVIMMRDISRAYAGEKLSVEICGGYEASLVEERLRASSHYDKAKEFYTTLFEDVEPECNPIPDETDTSADGSGVVTFEGKITDAEDVSRFCSEKGISENAFYVAAFGYTLAKFCAREDSVFTTVNNGRNDPRFSDSVSMFVKTYPVLCKTDASTVREYMKEVSTQLMNSLTYDVYSFEEISRDTGILADILFAYQGQFEQEDNTFCGLPCEKIELELNEAKAEMEFMVFPNRPKRSITYHCGYRKSSYTEGFIRNFIEVYEHVLSEFMKKETLNEITLLPEAQKQLLDDFNSTENDFDRSKTIVELFRERAKEFPDNTAVVYNESTYSYREVDRVSDNIALFLINKGIGSEDVVSVLIERSEYMPIVSLGVLKAGAAYQPLDPSYPNERLNFMIRDSKAKLLIADEVLTDKISDYDKEILLTKEILTLADVEAEERNRLLDNAPKPENMFILLYTSGSTGTPKGVVLEHCNILTFVNWYQKYYKVDENSRIAAYASYGFDACMMDMYPILASGGRLVVIPEDVRLDLIKLNEIFKEQKITHSFITTQVGRQFAQICDSPYLKHLSVGGETLTPLYPPEGFTLYNGYGPTECTIFTTIQPINRFYKRIPIGKSLDNMKLYVVDKNMNRLPIGVAGELCASGPQVARGYLSRPEKTAEVFTANPFDSQEGYERIYHTGDVVRLLCDGSIDFVGRRDGQVKIRGFRVELPEIEEIIRRFDGISDATVIAFDTPTLGKEIAAYIVSKETVDISKLKAFIRGEKPEYMVPSAIMQIEKIPLNANQKVDKRALPKPVITDTDEGASLETTLDIPLNALETELCSIAAEIIGTDDFGVMQSLSKLGLTSISAIRLATLIYKKYGISIKATDIISGGTIRTIEDAILNEWMEAKSTESTSVPVKESKRQKYFSLSFSQQGVYADCMASPNSTLYNTPFVVAFSKDIPAQELKRAVKEVACAHPSLSLRFAYDENNETVQYFMPDFEPQIPVKEMNTDELESYRAEFVRPFDLSKEPLARFEIIISDSLYLFMDIHHLITDGASVDIFIRQLCECLDGVAPEKENYTYLDFVEDEIIDSETEKFFEEQMADCEEATKLIPDIFEEGLKHNKKSISVKTNLEEVMSFAAKEGVTPASVYLAAEYIACSKYVCEDIVAITTISSGRSNMRIYNTMGMFVNTLPLTIKIDNDEETLSFIKRVAGGYVDTIANEHYPFAKVAQKFDFHPSVSYAYQVGVIDSYKVGDKEISAEGLKLEEAKLPCAVFISESDEGGLIQVDFDEALYSESMMLGFARSIENALRGLMSKKRISEISLTDEEQWKILDTYNPKLDLNYDHNDTTVSLFKKQVALNRDKTAAVYKEKSFTYGELDELTDRLARIIYAKLSAITGLHSLAEQVVPIITSRNENAFVLPLAVLKAGCAYEPLDPDYPNDRLNFMVKDSDAKLLIAERGLEERVGEFDGEIIFIDELHRDVPIVTSDSIPSPKPEDLLIMLYTSGTTGVPKGVQLIHENLVALAHGSALDGLYTKESRTATYASFGFDVNMADTLCTLLNGGTVYLIPEDIRMNMDELAAYFDEAQITDVLLTTQVGVQFINSFPKLKTLRMLTVGGEKLPAINIDKLSYTVYNGYGPTENCAGVSIFAVRKWEPNIPIGKPFPSINAYVLDKCGHRLPAGAAGEYCLSGPQVGRGYLNRPDKTSEAFEKCRFNDFRMYHTGDIVRYRQNGDVEFVGRRDGQVKIRGFRVELKEVEAEIRSFDGIDDVTVQAYDYESGGKYLAAFITSESKIDTKALAEYIKERKPAYMVPPVIMQIDEIPLSVNQKVDKKALPKPEIQKQEYVAPKNKAEEDFCHIIGEILGIERVGATDDFFEIGGSSITAMKVVLAAGKLGYSIVYQDVFANTTPGLLAEFVRSADEPDDINDANQPEIVENTQKDTVIGPDGYDYSAINSMLCNNTLSAFKNGESQKLNDVILTGPTGFLGIHVLYELIKEFDGKVYCICRASKGVSAKDRLKEYLEYYFEDDFTELFDKRIMVIEGDTTDINTFEKITPNENITLINCAANVSHFAKDDSIWRTNVKSVENMVSWCSKNQIRMVHISTGSVSGASRNGFPGDDFKFNEHMLFKGQYVEDNQYTHSKFIAERMIYEAVLDKKLNAKVLRVSNLSPRYKDGCPQINYESNHFLKMVRAYYTLGEISYDMLGKISDMSPIDYVARAVLALAQTPRECTCFILANELTPKLGDILLYMSRPDKEMRLVEPEEIRDEINKALADPDKAEIMQSFLVYANSAKEKNIKIFGFDTADSSYTLQILYRLGFRWPVINREYIQKVVDYLEKLGFIK